MSKIEENVVLIPIDRLTSFPNHPFRVMDGITWQLISGHRRKRACELIGVREIPAIVKEIDVDEAIIMIRDMN